MVLQSLSNRLQVVGMEFYFVDHVEILFPLFIYLFIFVQIHYVDKLLLLDGYLRDFCFIFLQWKGFLVIFFFSVVMY